MPSKVSLLIGLIAVSLIAGGLRFYRLGNWSFDADEISALIEEQVFFYGKHFADDSQYNNQYERLPRIVPVGYCALHAGYEVFGRDEAGSRVVPAIVGTVTVGIVFLLMVPVGSYAAALGTSLLIAFWQQHVLYSQMNHFYVVPMLFGFLCFLLGAYEVRGSRPIYPLLLSAAAVAAVFSHTVAAGAFAVACLGILTGTIAGRPGAPGVRRTSVLILSAGAAVLAAIIVFYVLPLERGWYQGLETGDSPRVAVMATVSRIGWPLVWLAVLGALFAVAEGGAVNWYWLTCALGSWAVILLMPLKFVFIARYALPLSLPMFVLAGTAIAKVFCLLRARSRVAAFAWMAVAPLVGLPSLASHYLDGSRADLRSPITYVKEHWRAGDRIICPSMGMKIAFDHYAPDCGPKVLLAVNPMNTLNEMAASGSRIWTVSGTYWGGRSDGDLDGWLGKRCMHEARFEKYRYDHYRFCTDVYLFDRKNGLQ
jgi:hypothetical protein